MNRFALLLIPLFLSATSWQDKINSGLQLATDSIQNTQGGYKDIVSRALEAAVKQLSMMDLLKAQAQKYHSLDI
ncbi:MAG: hypothetical protein ACTTJS_00595 [Wolinella sp.]